MIKKGFTLVELLVVIAIIGILAGIIVTGLQGAKASGRDARRVSDIKTIQLSLSLYYNDNGHYPCSLTQTGYAAGTSCYPSFTPTYMTTVPSDPTPGAPAYVYTALKSTAGSNCTGSSIAVLAYHLGAAMENSSNSIMTQDADEADTAEAAYGACTDSNSGNKFHGNALNCIGTTVAGSDNCYDVVPGL